MSKGSFAGKLTPLGSAAQWSVVVGEELPPDLLVSLFRQDMMSQGKVAVDKAKTAINNMAKVRLKQERINETVSNEKADEQPKGNDNIIEEHSSDQFLLIEWYLSRNGEQYGAYSWEELKQFVRNGRLHPDDLLWHSNLNDWIPAGQLNGLF